MAAAGQAVAVAGLQLQLQLLRLATFVNEFVCCCTFRAAAASHRIVRSIVLFSIVANDVATFAVAVDVDVGVGVGVGLTRRPHP